jgi:hypothetical protein
VVAAVGELEGAVGGEGGGVDLAFVGAWPVQQLERMVANAFIGMVFAVRWGGDGIVTATPSP